MSIFGGIWTSNSELGHNVACEHQIKRMAERQAESTRVSRFSRNGKRNADSFADQPSKVPKFDSKVFRNLEGLEETWKESLPGDITMIIVKVFAAKQGENVIRDWKPTTSEN